MTAIRPLVGVVSCTRTVHGVRMQAVAERFLRPLDEISGMAVVIVPSIERASDAKALARSFDAVLLTGSASNVAPARYGSAESPVEPVDHARDETVLALADAMIGLGRTVFGICRGHQELNVLHGGTLHRDLAEAGFDGAAHHPDADYADAPSRNLHPVLIRDGALGPTRTLDVVSAHRQGIDRPGGGLAVEAVSPDGLVEAVSCFDRAAVVGVQWHPEWNVASCPSSRAFFAMMGRAARGCRSGARALAA